MTQRNPILVFILPYITFGIYSWYWLVVTKNEMNKMGEKIPTAWIWLIPFGSLWWLWKYSEGVEHVTKEKITGILAFILFLLLGNIGHAIIQDSFNKIGSTAKSVTEPQAAPQPTPALTPAPEVTTDQPAK